jgi:hypothetical protein
VVAEIKSNEFRIITVRPVIKRIIILVFFVPSLVVAAEPPERKVENNVIISERDPKVRIELPNSVHYVGADRWVLYDMADCELHAFVDGDDQQNAQGLYWIQFEGYLPSKPDLKHQYDSPRHTTIGGLDFYVDTALARRTTRSSPGPTPSISGRYFAHADTRCRRKRCMCDSCICSMNRSARN